MVKSSEEEKDLAAAGARTNVSGFPEPGHSSSTTAAGDGLDTSRRGMRLRSAKGKPTVPAGDSVVTAIRVTKDSLEEVYLTKYQSVEKEDGSWCNKSQHMCFHSNSGVKMVFEIVDEDGRFIETMQCLGENVHESLTMFAGEEGEIYDAKRNKVRFKVCRICACHYFGDNASLDEKYPNVSDERKLRVPSNELLPKLHTEWTDCTFDDLKISVIGSRRMMEYWLGVYHLHIGHADLRDESGVIKQEIDSLRSSGLLESPIGTGGGGYSTGFFGWRDVRAHIIKEQLKILDGWLSRTEDALRIINREIFGGYFATRDRDSTSMPWHADLEYHKCVCRKILTLLPSGKKIMCIINRHTSEWFAFEVVHGMEVTMSREIGGPDNHGMMHAVPPGGGGHFLAIEYGKNPNS